MKDDQNFEPSEEIFKAICQTVLQSERGRWFLAEFTKRNRVADTKEVLSKLDAMRRAFEQQAPIHERAVAAEKSETIGIIRGQLEEIHSSISEARQEILAIRPRHTNNDPRQLSAATEELDAIVDSTEKATTDILAAAEALQDWAEKLREMGVNDEACNEIEEHATNIFMACSFQDITGQRTTKVMHAIRSLDQRVQVMMEMWSNHQSVGGRKVSLPITAENDPRPDAYLLNGPQPDTDGDRQNQIDEMLSRDEGELENLVASEKQAELEEEQAVIQSSSEEEETAEIDQDDIDALFDEQVA